MTKYGVGQPVRRDEDPRLLTGRGRFTDDVTPPDTLFSHVLRSPHAHADVLKLDTAAAARMPGVVAIYTKADLDADGIGTFPGPPPFFAALTKPDGSPLAYPPQYALAGDRVRHVGDPVAFVVAATAEQARDAAERIVVDYRPLPAITDTARAMDPGAPQLWPDVPNNYLFRAELGDKAAVEQAFARAAHIAKVDLVNQRLVQNAMEPRGAIGRYEAETDTLEVYTCNQNRHLLRDWLAGAFFKCPKERIRVLVDDVGGGFGYKTHPYHEQVLVMFAARRLRRPVKWTSDRSEGFLSDLHGRDNVTHAELALAADGRILALRVETVAGIGAYSCSAGVAIPTQVGPQIQTGVYDVPAAHVEVKCVVTNTTPVGPYRGAGRPEAVYIMERLVDVAAADLGMDATELRRRNLIKPAQMPYRNAMGITYDSGDFGTNMDMVMKLADWRGFPARREAAAKRGKLAGIGLTFYLETTAGNPTESAQVELKDDRVIVRVGTQPMGQGHDTSFKQIIAAELGIDFESVVIDTHSSDNLPSGGGSHGSRTSHIGSVASLNAGRKMIEKAKLVAGELMEASAADIEYADGIFRVAGTDKRIGLFDLAKRAGTAKLPAELAGAIAGDDTHTREAWSFPNGCHVCEVEVDPDTGRVQVVGYAAVDDVGRPINPLLIEGQVHGGVAQGVGQALLERTVYDPASGQLVTASFMDYTMPRADDLPLLALGLNVVPCTTNPLGVKGAGEAGALAAPPTVVAAVCDALKARGVRHLDMPLTPELVWRALGNDVSRAA